MIHVRVAGKHRVLGGWRAPLGEPKASPLIIDPTITFDPQGGVEDKYIPSAQDQGSEADCTAQTARESLTGIALKLGLGEVLFSAKFLWYWSRVNEGTSPTENTGCEVGTPFEVAATRGVPLKTTWDDNEPMAMQPPPEVDEEAALHKALVALHLPNLATMKSCLALGFGFGIGSPVPKQMMGDDCAQTGMVELPTSDSGWTGEGHAFTIWQWDDTIKIAQSIGAFLCLNHWSQQWGMRGRFYLPYDFITGGFAMDAHTIRRAVIK